MKTFSLESRKGLRKGLHFTQVKKPVPARARRLRWATWATAASARAAQPCTSRGKLTSEGGCKSALRKYVTAATCVAKNGSAQFSRKGTVNSTLVVSTLQRHSDKAIVSTVTTSAFLRRSAGDSGHRLSVTCPHGRTPTTHDRQEEIRGARRQLPAGTGAQTHACACRRLALLALMPSVPAGTSVFLSALQRV